MTGGKEYFYGDEVFLAVILVLQHMINRFVEVLKIALWLGKDFITTAYYSKVM